MNVGLRVELGERSENLQRDLARVTVLLEEGLERFGGPWLAGSEFTAVDAFFSPVAARFKTYGIKLDGAAGDYVERLFKHPSVQEWVQAGISEDTRELEHEAACLIKGRKILEDLSAK